VSEGQVLAGQCVRVSDTEIVYLWALCRLGDRLLAGHVATCDSRLDLICTALCDPKRRAALPWWLREGGTDKEMEDRCGLLESAPCYQSHDNDAAAVTVVRDLRRVCRAWRDAIGYTASAIEWLELVFDPKYLAPSEIDWPAFANLKELTLHAEITRLPYGLRSLRADISRSFCADRPDVVRPDRATWSRSHSDSALP
jgi:hypothetical protein